MGTVSTRGREHGSRGRAEAAGDRVGQGGPGAHTGIDCGLVQVCGSRMQEGAGRGRSAPSDWGAGSRAIGAQGSGPGGGGVPAEMSVCSRVRVSFVTRSSSHRTNQTPEYRPAAPTAAPSAPWTEMPQHSMGDKPLVSVPQLVFPSPPSATDSECGHSPPSRRPSLGSPPGHGAPCPAAHSPSDSCSQPLCPPLAEKHGCRAPPDMHYVAAGPQSVACGWWAFAPKCLQAFNTPRGFLLFLCAAAFLQGMTVNGLVSTVITSIERRYDLPSYQSGLIASSYDVAACLCLTFVSYFGGNGHKPRWLGWGVLVMGAGSLLFALPHFTAGAYEAEAAEGVGTCRANRSVACRDSASGLAGYRLVFMLGQFLHGVGATPLYTLGVTYLDENVKSSYSPVYIGKWGCRGHRAGASTPLTCLSSLAAPVVPGEVAGERGPSSGAGVSQPPTARRGRARASRSR